MFRVSYSDTATEKRWTLCGRLAGPWVEELRSLWRSFRERTPGARAVVDLTDVVFIEDGGEALLEEMQSDGAEFLVAGVENKHLLSSLKSKEERALRRGVEHLGAPCSKSVTAQREDK